MTEAEELQLISGRWISAKTAYRRTNANKTIVEQNPYRYVNTMALSSQLSPFFHTFRDSLRVLPQCLRGPDIQPDTH